jgi:transcriptional regulator with PAS, ATPase and Fis domain
LFATNAPLNQWVVDGRFRQDLLFRINTVEIEIPPLKDRPEDIIDFVEFYLNRFKTKYKKPDLTITPDAMKILKSHNWPGNVREVQHTLERGVIMAEGNEIGASDFNLTKFSNKPENNDIDNLNLLDIEKLMVKKAMDKHEGNISKAAKELGLTRAALYRRIEKFNI